MLPNCVFCGILNKKEKVIWENEQLFAFHSLQKCGSLEHILICPKIHIKDVNSLTIKDADLVRDLKVAGAEVLRLLRPNEKNFRFGFHFPPFNSMDHLHLHGLIEPLNSFVNNKILFSNFYFLRTVEKVIANLKK